MADNVENEGLEEEKEEFEVVVLDSEEGEVELVVIDTITITEEGEKEEKVFALVADLEDVEAAEDMTEEEFQEVYGDEGIVFLMRVDGEVYMELTEEENKTVREHMDQMIAENLQLAEDDA